MVQPAVCTSFAALAARPRMRLLLSTSTTGRIVDAEGEGSTVESADDGVAVKASEVDEPAVGLGVGPADRRAAEAAADADVADAGRVAADSAGRDGFRQVRAAHTPNPAIATARSEPSNRRPR